MEEDAVPQDNSPTYGGLRKLIYAVDKDGNYKGVTSSGWETESFSTELAVAEIERLRDAAWERARLGEQSPLEFHMCNRRMDFETLAMVTGIWRWRIRRHFKQYVFEKLSQATLTRYAEAMDISIRDLKTLPPRASKRL